MLCHRCQGLRPCVESVLEPEDFSPVLTWILGYFWSLPWESVLVSCGGMPVRLPSKLYQQCHASLHVEQGICGFTSRLSHEAFPRGFPTGLSHVPPWCDSILGLKVEAVQGKQVSLEWTETSGAFREWWHDLEFLSPLLFRAPPLEMRQERREFFQDTQGKDPSSRATRRKHGSSECGLGSRASSRVETGMSGNFLSCSKGVKDPLEVPEFRCD